MKPTHLLCALLALAGCAQAAAPSATKPAPKSTEAPAVAKGTPSIEAIFAGRVPGKPPLVTVQLDVTLTNPASEARWFLFPSSLPESGPADGGVTGVEPFEASGEGRAVVGQFLGTRGFSAVLVPAGGVVKLSKFPIRVWGEGGWKGTLKVDAIVAKDVTIGTQPIATWFGANPASDAKVSADMSKAKRLASKFTEDRGELPVVLSGETKLPLEIAVQ